MGPPQAVDQPAVDTFVAAAHEAPEVAVRWLRRNPSLAARSSSWGESALQAASHLGHTDLLQALVDGGVELDLFALCALADIQAVAAMLPSGVVGDARGVHGLPILHFAVVSGQVAMVRSLIAAGAAVNPPGASLSPLHSAVAVGSTELVHVLLEAGADAEVRDAFGATPPDWARELDGDHSEVVRLFSARQGQRDVARR